MSDLTDVELERDAIIERAFLAAYRPKRAMTPRHDSAVPDDTEQAEDRNSAGQPSNP